MGSDNLHWLKKKTKLKRDTKRLREYTNSILIVCEGEKTEPKYFNEFRVSGVEVRTIGTGRNTISLVKEAVKKWEEFAEEGDGYVYENLWCVFDKDDFPDKNYNQAFKSIKNEQKKLNNKRYIKKTKREIKIQIAYSNEAFELWYLLHYDFIDTAISRAQYQQKLIQKMGEKYKKNDPDMYWKLVVPQC